MTLSNKFVTHFEEKTIDDISSSNDDCKKSDEYGFGIAFKYANKSSSSSYYCPKKYIDLKTELLENQISSLDKFEYESLQQKAVQLLESIFESLPPVCK